MTLNLKTLFLLSLLAKVLLSLFIPLTLDEYYYFLWGQYPSLSYFDHPPMVGWLMILSQPLAGLHESLIRLPFLVMTHATLGVWLLILKDHLNSRRLLLFAWIALLNPLWGWGVFIATPDIPLLFFWSLSLYFCKEILNGNQWKSYLGLSFALGLGFLSKYQVALFLPALLWMLWQQKAMTRLLSLKALLAVLMALLVCSPVFLWNHWHDWASIDFQWNHGMKSKYWKWNIPLEYMLSQIFIVFPTFLIFFFQKDKSWKKHWLLPFLAFPFLFFLYTSFKARVEANWVIMALPSLYALAVLFSGEKALKSCRKTVLLWGGLLTIVFMAVLFSGSLPKNKIKLFEAKKFDPLLEVIDPHKQYYAHSYQMASFLTVKTEKLVCKLNKYGRKDHFQFIPGCTDFADSFFYLTEKSDVVFYEKDFPGYKIVATTPVGDNYKMIEVRRE